jgi:hypothetical protein
MGNMYNMFANANLMSTTMEANTFLQGMGELLDKIATNDSA